MSDSIIDIQENQFDETVLKASGPVLVDYWAEWCGPCKLVEPVLEEIAQDYKGRLQVCRVNVDNHADIAQKYSVRGIPTFMLFKDGNNVAHKVGALSKGQLCEFIDTNL